MSAVGSELDETQGVTVNLWAMISVIRAVGMLGTACVIEVVYQLGLKIPQKFGIFDAKICPRWI